MAKKVSFGKKSKSAESFPFGLNAMSKKDKAAYRKKLKKAGQSVGGGS